LIEGNLVVGNDTPNFAPKGNIVAGVPRGTGIMVMANEYVTLSGNVLANNSTAQIMVLAYPNKYDDKNYNPYPRRIMIGTNQIIGGGTDPQIPGGGQLKAAFGGALPPLLWDGLGGDQAIVLWDSIAGITLNLPAQGAGADKAQPAPMTLKLTAPYPMVRVQGAPWHLDARIAR
jgi:hypothetical protein